jgi:hypothetical protein
MTVSLAQLPGLLQGLRACLQAELQRRADIGVAGGGAPLPGKIEVRPGAAFAPYFSTTEDECKCGVAWVRLSGITMGGTGQDEALPRNAAGALCGPQQWTATVELGVQRCPTLGDAHTNPTAVESLADTLVQLSDERAMRAALRCCFGSTQDVTPGEYTPLGPEGLCYGGQWSATMVLDDCDDCTPE